jgi:ATP/maltotriose-dependent transcriptional regulator MalT
VAAAAFALTGDLERAADLARKGLRHAQDLNSPVYLCLSQQSLALVHTLAGDWEAAFAALDEAQRLADGHGFPYEQVRILLQRAFVHSQRRQPDDLATAGALMTEAQPVLHRLGVRIPVETA